MFILSPKTNFLGGSLVSISHLAKLFPKDKLLLWKSESKFLEANNVHGNVIDGQLSYESYCKGLGIITVGELYNSIWCNDTCIDTGYYNNCYAENKQLWQFLGNFKHVHLVNHQPINRYKTYLMMMLRYLYDHGVEEINIYNYRACWNTEWKNELEVLFPQVKVHTLPYHYYYYDIVDELGPMIDEKLNKPIDKDIVFIGRSNSKCKIQSRYDEMHDELVTKGYKVTQLIPDNNCNNVEFLKKLINHDIVASGYYYGGEGDPEMTELHNHLEWSYMDALIVGCLPITSSLFELELLRLQFPTPILPYELHELTGDELVGVLDTQIRYPFVDEICESEGRSAIRQRLLDELSFGNHVIKNLIMKD